MVRSPLLVYAPRLVPPYRWPIRIEAGEGQPLGIDASHDHLAASTGLEQLRAHGSHSFNEVRFADLLGAGDRGQLVWQMQDVLPLEVSGL